MCEVAPGTATIGLTATAAACRALVAAPGRRPGRRSGSGRDHRFDRDRSLGSDRQGDPEPSSAVASARDLARTRAGV